MRKIITYSLLILVLFTFNFKTINYCFKISNITIALNQDYDCDEKNSEKKADEKNEKKDLSEYLFFNRLRNSVILSQLSFTQHRKSLYDSSDYSVAVYSPPDQLIG